MNEQTLAFHIERLDREARTQQRRLATHSAALVRLLVERDQYIALRNEFYPKEPRP